MVCLEEERVRAETQPATQILNERAQHAWRRLGVGNKI